MSNYMNLLTFKLGGQFFAFNINFVREVIEFSKITYIPLAPEYIEGIINLRGSAIPIIDLRKKLKIAKSEITPNTSIVILEIRLNNEIATVGAIVDEVKDVVEIDEESLESAPAIGMKIHPEYVEGITKYNNEFIIVVNIGKVFSFEELDEIKSFEPIK